MLDLGSIRNPSRDTSGRGALHIIECRKLPKTEPYGPIVNRFQMTRIVPGEFEFEVDILEHPPECDALKYSEACSLDDFLGTTDGWDDFLKEETPPDGKWWVWVEWRKVYADSFTGYEWDENLGWAEYDDGKVPETLLRQTQ